MTMEERIEAATTTLRLTIQRGGQFSFREEAQRILRFAFPELFDGTAWLAPWEVTRSYCQRLQGRAAGRLRPAGAGRMGAYARRPPRHRYSAFFFDPFHSRYRPKARPTHSMMVTTHMRMTQPVPMPGMVADRGDAVTLYERTGR